MERFMFNKKIVDLIKKRISVRSFNGKPIDNSSIEKLSDFITIKNKFYENRFRFSIVKKEFSGTKNKLGTYGWIGGTDTFIVGVSKKNDKNIENYGYAFEEIILYATELGLGTCWLGVAFNHKNFSEKVTISNDEIIPAVSPLGYKNVNRRFFDSIVRKIMKSDNRFDWNKMFFKDNFGNTLSGESAGKYKLALEMLRLAPSAGNKQPWRIIYADHIFHFYLERDPGYTKAVKAYEIQRLDIGIAMSHFELTSKENGLKGKWEYSNPDIKSPGLEYIISWKE
jgi:nitroreductase